MLEAGFVDEVRGLAARSGRFIAYCSAGARLSGAAVPRRAGDPTGTRPWTWRFDGLVVSLAASGCGGAGTQGCGGSGRRKTPSQYCPPC